MRQPLLDLVSAGEPLQIVIPEGNGWSVADVRWAFRTAPTAGLGPSVAGPFASFESAERAAMRWRSIGVDALRWPTRRIGRSGRRISSVPEDLMVRDWSTTPTALSRCCSCRRAG